MIDRITLDKLYRITTGMKHANNQQPILQDTAKYNVAFLGGASQSSPDLVALSAGLRIITKVIKNLIKATDIGHCLI